MQLICGYCSKEFERKNLNKAYHLHFCSRQCKGKWHSKNKRGKNHPNYKHGMSEGSETTCLNCQKKFIRRCNFQKYCNTSCQLKYEYANKIRNPTKIVLKAHEKVRELAQKNELPAQKYEYRLWRAKEREQKKIKSTFSIKEQIMHAHLMGHGINFIEEMAFETYNVDFGIPELKTIIEVTSGCWHTSPSKKQAYSEKEKIALEKGWRIFYNKCPVCDFSLWIKHICIYCGKLFETGDKRTKFCSRDCYDKNRKQI